MHGQCHVRHFQSHKQTAQAPTCTCSSQLAPTFQQKSGSLCSLRYLVMLSEALRKAACVRWGLQHQAHVCRSYLQSSQQPRLYYKAGALGKLVVEQCPLLNSIYWPSPLAFSRDTQTCVTGAAVHNYGNYSFHKHTYKVRTHCTHHIGLITNCAAKPLSPLPVQRACTASQDVSAVNAVSGSRQLKMHRALQY